MGAMLIITLSNKCVIFVSLQVLDTKDLQVFKVTVNGQDAKFVFGEKHSFKGTPLEITLPFELSRYTLLPVPLGSFQNILYKLLISLFGRCVKLAKGLVNWGVAFIWYMVL